jgi:hypothetical protein
VPAFSRAFDSRMRARCCSPFSLSSLTAASQICSELLLALNASLRIARASATAPCRPV